jgi:hypothetical protein
MYENAAIVFVLSNRTFVFNTGAMYVSYGLNAATGIAVCNFLFGFFGTALKTAFVAIIIALIIFVLMSLRWARNIYINMFVSYDPNWDKE